MRYHSISIFFFSLLSLTTGQSQGIKLVLPKGHSDFVNYGSFSPDNRYVITASYDNSAKLWEVSTGKLLRSLEGHEGVVWYAEFSRDQRYIVTCSNDSTAIVWNATTGSILQVLKGHKKAVYMAVFSKDGKRILTSSMDHTAKIWDRETGKILLDLVGHNGEVLSALFNADETKIVTASEDHTANVWDATTGKAIRSLKIHTARLNAASFSKDSKKVLTSAFDGTVIVWQWEKDTVLAGFNKIKGIVPASFSKDGEKMVFAGDTLAFVYNIRDDKALGLLSFTSQVNYANFSEDGNKLVFALEDFTAIIFDLKKRTSKNLVGHRGPVRIASFSPDGRYILTCSKDNTAKLWNTESGVLQYTLEGLNNRLSSCDLNPDGKRLAISGWDSVIRVINIETAVVIQELALKESDGYIDNCNYSHNGTMILATSISGPYVFQPDSNKIILSPDPTPGDEPEAESRFNAGAFSPDDKMIAMISLKGAVQMWSTVSKKRLRSFKTQPPDFFYNSIQFKKDGNTLLIPFNAGESNKIVFATYNHLENRIAYGSLDGTVKVVDANSKKLLFNLTKHTKTITSIVFSSNDKYLLTTSFDKTAKLWDMSTGELLKDLKEHSDAVFDGCFVANDQKVFTCSWDGTIKLWDLQSGKVTVTMILLKEAENIAVIPDGYYKCPQNAAKLLRFVTDSLEVLTFEQLDVKYNRPDKVLEAMGNSDTALIKSYRKAWEKRIKKLGIDTTSFSDGYSVPKADFTNRNTIGYEQKSGTLKLLIKGTDSTNKIDRFNVWVNEIPIYGQRGINIRKRNKNDIDTTITVKLSQGENKIETSITNVNGTESYRMPLTVNYTPAVKQKESVRFIGIGIDQFADNKYNLQYSTKDIRDLSTKLKEKYKDDIIIDTLFNENVTVSNVKALKQKLLQTSENDKVIVAYSGHGMLSKDYDYYLSTYSVNFEKPEQSGLSYDELESLLDSIPARKKLMLIDACHSGEVDKEDLITLNATTDSLLKGIKPVAYKKDGQLGLKNSFELMQSLFVNVGKSTGATIISAAAGTQFALERNDLKNGVFTYCILEAMNKYPTMKISALKKTVGERVEQLTHGLQKPTFRNEPIAVDWTIW
jgi:WD40 repeat protein